VDVDHLQLVGRYLNRFAVVMRLDELAPVGGRAASGRHRWWLERFAEVCQDFPDRPRLRGSVVLPVPRKPESTVTGSRRSTLSEGVSLFLGERSGSGVMDWPPG
jgi:hypothetical protein